MYLSIWATPNENGILAIFTQFIEVIDIGFNVPPTHSSYGDQAPSL